MYFLEQGKFLVGCPLSAASAVDVKVRGQWSFGYGYYSNNGLSDSSETGFHADRWRARQRVRAQIEFIADENLSALLNFEHNANWGGNTGSGTTPTGTASGVNNNYGAIDADGNAFFVREAYMNWTLPGTKVKTRMGIQATGLPHAVSWFHSVLDTPVAGVTVNTQFTPEVGLTALWARPYASTTEMTGGATVHNDADVFALTLPITTSVVKATPYAMYARLGTNSDFFARGAVNSNRRSVGTGSVSIFPSSADQDSYANAWWIGTTLELPVLDPFFVQFDAVYGSLKTGDEDLDTRGYFLATEFGYKFSFGKLSFLGWYSSGDKDADDYRTIPFLSVDGAFDATIYGSDTQGHYRNYSSQLTNTGLGLWGLGIKLADVKFVDKLSHTAQFTVIGGTNKGEAIEAKSASHTFAFTTDNTVNGGYLATSDRAYEISLRNLYQATQNLLITADLAYMWLDLGDSWANKDDSEGSFAAMLGFRYNF